MDKVLLSIPEAVQVTGLGRTKLLQLVYSGRLPSLRVGRRRFITPDSLREFVASLQEEAQAGEGR